MKYIYITLFCLFYISHATAQHQITGKVISESTRQPLKGATVEIKGTQYMTQTRDDGIFILVSRQDTGTLVVSSVGYFEMQTRISASNSDTLYISLQEREQMLSEVEIVSTGYQQLPRERATGSFELVDRELLNRRVSTNLIDRLEDVTPGLVFNRNRNSASNPFSIRGQSGIFSNSRPLIVIDNFQYDGDLENINPNDIESVTVLKDAAAASIWGARAGNGVIVITTKKGRPNQAPKVSFNSNVTVGDKPDLFYLPVMGTTDFIDIERMLFDQGYYGAAERSASKTPLSPVVELLIAQRDGMLTEQEASSQIDTLKSIDIRDDLSKYFYRNGINQQYAFNVTGGSAHHQYYLSAGYDNESQNLHGNAYDRITLNAANTFSFLKDKVQVKSDIYYTKGKITRDQNIPIVSDLGMVAGNRNTIYPYARLADNNGNPLAVTRGYRTGFVNGAQQSGLLDWQYRPLEELGLADNHTGSTDYRLNTQVTYKIISGLSLDVLYQFGQTLLKTNNRQDVNSYFTRDLINRYSQIQPDGTLSYPIPVGDILNQSFSTATNHNVRGQLNYRYSQDVHDLTAIAGYELKDYGTVGNSYRVYGYDNDHATVDRVDYISTFPQYHNNLIRTAIPYGNSASELTDRFISYFTNAAYTYNSLYTLSASARFDRSNLFGVRTNQQGVPLWSVGGAWSVSGEDFYHLDWLPVLKTRATFGYNGNVDRTISAYTTAIYYSSSWNLINAPWATVSNPPNPELRWERMKMVNVGVDFETKGSRLRGTFDFFWKRGIDLIGDMTVPASRGVTSFRGNSASTTGSGFDLSLNSWNTKGAVDWRTDFLISFYRDKVTGYERESVTNAYVASADGGGYPLERRPLYAIYSYRWEGLDPETGNPQGYLDGNVSQDYNQILATTTPAELVYHGPARPPLSGALRNTFTFGKFSVSANVSFRLGYYFRRTGISYNDLLTGQGYHTGAEYPLRWQRPGDELITSVPSMPNVRNVNRDNLYRYSKALVEKGDHIRLQDLRIDYSFGNVLFPKGGKNARLYIYANNLGVIWKSSDSDLDPDYPFSIPPVRTIAFGVQIDL